ERGYSITTYEGKAVVKAEQLEPGAVVALRFAEGHAAARVTAVSND
ncbi:MAG: exodeoxyribonuclease VII large subunit, partial [Alphaproteobacteria bacterium]|nr:exodeoxyribonuclease VII large subunit [Alphaproteobacteria bacterium]